MITDQSVMTLIGQWMQLEFKTALLYSNAKLHKMQRDTNKVKGWLFRKCYNIYSTLTCTVDKVQPPVPLQQPPCHLGGSPKMFHKVWDL